MVASSLSPIKLYFKAFDDGKHGQYDGSQIIEVSWYRTDHILAHIRQHETEMALPVTSIGISE